MKNEKIQYNLFKERNLEKRYLPPALLKSVIKSNFYDYKILGESFEGREIYLLNHGFGKKRILLWSQMHGNETTATRAMLDIWNFLHSSHPLARLISKKITIDYIPQLNPDGAKYYTRRNATHIDLNRDFIHSQSIELPILKNQAKKNNYTFLFNLHDQRNIFHPKNSNQPATLSFLSPSFNLERDENTVRENAMKLIVSIANELKPQIPHGFARFTDEFYPKATGDNFQKLNLSTILIECGHYLNDLNRNKTREFTFYALLSAFKAIAEDSWQKNDIYDYFSIPMNDNKAFDFIYKNVKIKNKKHECVIDLGILYKEVLVNNQVKFKAEIAEIGDLSDCFGYTEFDANQQLYSDLEYNIPSLNVTANFKIGDLIIENGKIIHT